MKLVASESIGDVVALLASVVGSAVLTIVGTIAEQAALQNVLAGNLVLGAWEAWMGTTTLVVGVYLLGYRECWPRLRQFSHSG